MQFDIRGGVSLFFFVIFFAYSLFYGFAPYDWICEYHTRIGINTATGCNLPHWGIVLFSLACYLLAIMAYKGFDVKTIFLKYGVNA